MGQLLVLHTKGARPLACIMPISDTICIDLSSHRRRKANCPRSSALCNDLSTDVTKKSDQEANNSGKGMI